MRPWPALRKTTRKRISRDTADRYADGDHTGPEHSGLGHLLDTLRAPATPGELAGEKTVVAAYSAAQRPRAARGRRKKRIGTRVIAIALALLVLGAVAQAARTGNLPPAAQQHAHHLFSALGVPAPRTGTPPLVVQLGWCDKWGSLGGDNRAQLIHAAGSENRVPGYCDGLRHSATPSPARSR